MLACMFQGVLIEPNPKEFAKIFANRPQAIAVNAAVCAQKQNVHFISKPSKHLVGKPGEHLNYMLGIACQSVMLEKPECMRSSHFLRWT